MTEHLKKQIEDAALGCRVAKSKVKEATESIKSLESCNSSLRNSIKQSELSIESNQAGIATLFDQRAAANAEFDRASERLSFLNRELIDHPYADR